MFLKIRAQILNSSERSNNITTCISEKQPSLSNTNNFNWCTNPGTQFHDERLSPETLLRKIKDTMSLFLYHILGLHFLEAFQQ